MSNSLADFEKFITAEANRYFQAAPYGSAALSETNREAETPPLDAINHAASRQQESSAPDNVQARPTPERIQWTNGFQDLSRSQSYTPSPFALPISPQQQSTSFDYANPLGSKIPFRQAYEQPILDLLKAEQEHVAARPPDTNFQPDVNRHNPLVDAERYTTGFDVRAIRTDFPILGETIHGHRLIWLDNAATTQKPQVVIDRIAHFYAHENSNIHRAAHELAARSTDAYEDARSIIKNFVNARSTNEIVFTRGTTEAINLVASTWGEQNLGPQDEIILSHLEHHANIVPWQLLSQRKGFTIRVIPVDDEGNLLVEEYIKLLTRKTRLVAFTHVSNALGTVTPAKQIIELAHQVGAMVLLDGAQSISHMPIDLSDLNPDFFVFSGHKIFGPTGIGVLYGREDLLNHLPPYQGGGNMIKDVRFEKTEYHQAPNRFEAGTGNIADAVGLGAALQYVDKIGIHAIQQYEHDLLRYATNQLQQIPGITLIGTAREKASVLSFTLAGYTNDEVGVALNKVGIAVRTGHHCAQPILRRLGYESSVRPSIAFYNTHQEIDFFIHAIDTLAWQNKRYY